jgi:hypothetical protein
MALSVTIGDRASLRKFLTSSIYAARALYQSENELRQSADIEISSNRNHIVEDNELEDAFLTVITPLNLFNELNKVGTIQKGQVLSGYEANGYKFGITFGIGPSIKLLTVDIGITVAASVTAQKTNARLLIVQKQPNKIFVADGASGYQFVQDNPIFLGSYRGSAHEVSFNLTAGASFSLEASVPGLSSEGSQATALTGEALSLGFTFDAGVNVSAAVKGTYMLLYDESPRFYESTSDSDFLNQVEANIGVGKKGTKVREIQSYLKAKYENSSTLLKTINSKKTLLAKSTNDTMIALVACLNFEMTQAGPNQTTTSIMELESFKKQLGIAISEDFVKGRRYNAAKVIEKFENLKYFAGAKGIKPATGSYTQSESKSGDITTIEVQPKEANLYTITCETTPFSKKISRISVTTIDGVEKELKSVRFTPQPSLTAFPGSLKKQIEASSFLSYVGGEAGTGADIQASIGALSQSLNAGASAEGMAKYATYRFQSQQKAATQFNPLFFTQDTRVTYKQITFGASAGKYAYDNLFRSVYYVSSLCYWKAPSGAVNIEYVETPASAGSGLAFGISISEDALANWVVGEDSALKKILEKRLHVSGETLDAFVTQLNIEVPLIPIVDPAVDTSGERFGSKYVLLEVSFAALEKKSKFKMAKLFASAKANYQLDSEILTSWKKEFDMEQSSSQVSGQTRAQSQIPPKNFFSPQCIRLRQRVSDLEDNLNVSDKGFTLGMDAFIGSVEFNMQEVSKAGNESTIDIFTFEIPNPVPPPPYSNVGEEEKIIPPVALFFQ